MRLLNTQSLELSRPFVPSEVPDYAIFSHRWNTEEVTFSDMCDPFDLISRSRMRAKNGFPKIAGACKQALKDGYGWIWIDSCCIDKSSSAELQEAINSMWRYYADSNICYVYLADVDNAAAGWTSDFAQSEWFTRGWTLQELIAPLSVEFYAKNWDSIGTKLQRYKEIAKITSINPKALNLEQEIDYFNYFSTAEKLSWVSHRKVTREEDESYSLLGLFDVNMPLLYGEGREKAFIRFQEAVYNATADHSIFLYRHSDHRDSYPLLASSPTNFCDKVACNTCLSRGGWHATAKFHYGSIVASTRWNTQAHEQIMTTVTKFRNEISTVLPVLPYQHVSDKLEFPEELTPGIGADVTGVAILNYTVAKYPQGALCLLLNRQGNEDACTRLSVLPAVLPHLGDLETRLERTKLLFCPQSSNTKDNADINTVFSLDSGSLLVREWHVEGCHSHSLPTVPPAEYPRFGTQTKISANPRRPTHVSCHLSCLDPDMLLTIRIIRVRGIWSIKEVCAQANGSRRDTPRKLLCSSVLVDRCTVVVAHGETLLLRLRRLPSAARSHEGSVVNECYQISVDFQHVTK